MGEIDNTIRAFMAKFAEAVAKRFKAEIIPHIRMWAHRTSAIHHRRFHKPAKRRALRK